MEVLEKQLWKDMQDKQLLAITHARASTRQNESNIRVIRHSRPTSATNTSPQRQAAAPAHPVIIPEANQEENIRDSL